MGKITKINSEIKISKEIEYWIEEWKKINGLNRGIKKGDKVDQADKCVNKLENWS